MSIQPSRTSGRDDEIYGETLIYSSVLSDADRLKVEDYLNYKWLGVLPGNCSDLRGATVAGTGVVSVATMADMPKIASTFAGTVKADINADLAITIDATAGTVTGALIAPSATLDFPATATVTVTLRGRLPNGRATYSLVDCAGFAREVEWTLSFVDGDGKRRMAALRTVGGKVLLDVRGKGTMVIML